MKNHLIISLLLISFIICPCFGQNDNKFSLHGITDDIADGKMLLLQNPLSNKFIDSTEVVDNTFVLNTQLTNFPAKLILWRDGSTAKTIWVENNKMTFDSSHSSFDNAIIGGSITDSMATALKTKYKELKSYEEIVSYELGFIKNNPNNILSAHNLSIMATVFGKEESAQLFKNFSSQNKQSPYGKIVADFLNLQIHDTPQIGDKYVDFSMNNINGEQEKLSELDGKYILLEFWASWCVPCREENPELVRVYNKFKEFNFEIFAVSLDDNKENWIKAIRKDNLNWKHVSDLEGRNNKAALIYAVNGIPDNLLIDENGIIIARNLRFDKLDKVLSGLFLNKEYVIQKKGNGTSLRLNNSIIWQDEDGKILSESEVKKMLDTQNYIPHLDTEKNIMVLKKQ